MERAVNGIKQTLTKWNETWSDEDKITGRGGSVVERMIGDRWGC